MIGWHVDDGTGVACDVNHELDFKKNRVIQYLNGLIQVTYATTLTGWHGNKALGYTLSCDDARQRVTMDAPDALAQVSAMLLEGVATITPKHIMTSDFDELPAGEVPPVGDPLRDKVLADMELTRRGLGFWIWLYNAYPKAAAPTNMLCANMAFPSADTLKNLRFMTMHVVRYPEGASYGGWGVVGLEQPVELIPPFTPGKKAMYFHYFSDANLKQRSLTGGVGMLAGGPTHVVCQRQHLKGPDSHTVEVVAAGNNCNNIVAQNGLLQELRIRLGQPTPLYLDSKTTVFVALNDTAVKKSVWLTRRVAVLQDASRQQEIIPLHISEKDMVADPFTKYLPYAVWDRHMSYMLNRVPE